VAVVSRRRGNRRQVVLATFTIRSALRSSSWATRIATPTNRRSGRAMPGNSKMRRHWSSTAWRRESMASSSATTRSAPSRSPSMSASVPEAIASRVSDASRTMSTRTSSTRVTTRGSEWTGTTSEETTLRSWRDHATRAATKPTVSPLFTCAPPRGHGAATPSPYHPRRVTDPFTVPGGDTLMRRSFVRRCGLVLAALALPILLIGTGASAAPKTNKLASATLNGDGSTFQLGFNQVVIGAFKPVQKAVTINYQGNGSGAGRTDFVNGVVDFAGTDAAYKASDPQPPKPFFYFPTVVAPITVSYNVSGVSNLKLSPDTIGKIFQGQITTWDDPAIKSDNPSAKLPSTK